MINVLVNAYAVSPIKGSEPGMGWNWITNLAKHCNIYVITEGEWKVEIEEELDKLPQKDNIHFYYLPVSENIRRMCWNQGDWRFYFFYRKWQIRAYKLAKEICKDLPIDVIHQLNMVGYREPGILWKIQDKPLVWGPIGGFGGIPIAFLKLFAWKEVFKQLLKQLINIIQVHTPYINKAIKNADTVIACNSVALKVLKKFKKENVFLIGEVGTSPIESAKDNFNKWDQGKLTVCWIGKDDSRKALSLALETFKRLSSYNIELNVLGVSYDSVKFPGKENLSNVTFHEWMPLKDVQEYLSRSHLFFFTSLFEATGTVVLESLSNGIPVICHDTCGQGDVIDSSCGIKVPMKSVNDSIQSFEEAIIFLSNNRDHLRSLSDGAYRQAASLSWEKKSELVFKIYSSLLID